MNTNKTKGDILAERIEAITHEYYLFGCLGASLRDALAEYRRPLPAVEKKPVLTPEQIADGWIEWHGGECPVWGESTPTVMFRAGKITENETAESWYWAHDNAYDDIVAYLPDPYEALKKAHAEGKVIQAVGINGWRDVEPIWSDDFTYRVKPEPVMVPLGPEDVPPLSLIRKAGESESWHWRLVSYVTGEKMVCADRGYLYAEIQCTHEISRDGGKTWERCEKEGK